MKNFLIKVLIVVFLTDLVLVGWRVFRNNKDTRILSYFTAQTPTSSPTIIPTQTPKPTPTLTPTPTPISTPSLSPTPTPVPQPKFSREEIHGFIERFAAQYSVDPNILRHIAVCESGLNASVRNGPYAGLYQFGDSAWKSNRGLMGEDIDSNLRYNAEEAVQTAAFIVSRGKGNLWPNCFP